MTPRLGDFLRKTEVPGSGVIRLSLIACPLGDCEHEFKTHEPRSNHYLEEHSPQDFGLSPRLAADGGERP